MPGAQVAHATVDLTRLESVEHFTASMAERFDAVDILVLNAGVLGGSHLTGDGFEHTGQVNHLAQFLLATRMLPQLRRASRNPRIVVVASGGAILAPPAPDWNEVWHRWLASHSDLSAHLHSIASRNTRTCSLQKVRKCQSNIHFFFYPYYQR